MTDPSRLDELRRFDTPTVWNALATLRGRSVSGYTRGPLVASRPKAPPMVGYAKTARLVSSEPSPLARKEQSDIRFAYYRYLDAGPRPAIVVVEDNGAQPGLGAFWGEVNSAIHRGFGISGVITNGAVRDLDALDEALPILAGAVCLSNGHAHLTEINIPVSVMGLKARPGDLLHADRHGAMVIPPEHLEALPGAIVALRDRERDVIACARRPGFDADAMIRAWKVMEAGG